jgi:hypothetical protein
MLEAASGCEALWLYESPGSGDRISSPRHKPWATDTVATPWLSCAVLHPLENCFRAFFTWMQYDDKIVGAGLVPARSFGRLSGQGQALPLQFCTRLKFALVIVRDRLIYLAK